MQQLSQYVEQLIKPVLSKRGIYQVKIFSAWSEIVGERIASFTVPSKITFSERQGSKHGTLHVSVNNSAVVSELYYSESLILEKIAMYFGYKAIVKLKIIQNPQLQASQVLSFRSQPVISEVQSTMLNESVVEVQDDRLKSALINLGSYLL